MTLLCCAGSMLGINGWQNPIPKGAFADAVLDATGTTATL